MINRTVETVAKGQDRILLVMATGTGKIYTAFQIVYRLFKAKAKNSTIILALTFKSFSSLSIRNKINFN